MAVRFKSGVKPPTPSLWGVKTSHDGRRNAARGGSSPAGAGRPVTDFFARGEAVRTPGLETDRHRLARLAKCSLMGRDGTDTTDTMIDD
ncbi:MAG: hypothetical protein ACT4TC_06675 [Myxococcaceae bacterium]